MPKFDRYLLSRLTVLFGFFALVLVSIYWVNQAVRLFDQLIGDGQSALVFLEFSALTLPNVIRLVLPVAAFAATVYTVNRLNSESELVVVQAMGYSPLRLARPVFVFGLGVAVLVSVLNHFLVPISRTGLAERRNEIAENITARLLTEGKFLHPVDGITFYIREITPVGELHDIFLADARNPASRTTYTAERALLTQGDDGPKLLMFEGMSQTLRREGRRLAVTRFRDSVFDIAALMDPGRIRGKTIEELSTPQLLRADPAQSAQIGSSPAEFLYEGHARIAQPFLALAGALIGFAALMQGGFSRFGVWRQIILAVVMLIGLQLMDNAAADFARSGSGLWPVVYLSPLVGVVVAYAMLRYAGRAHRTRRGRIRARGAA